MVNRAAVLSAAQPYLNEMFDSGELTAASGLHSIGAKLTRVSKEIVLLGPESSSKEISDYFIGC
jgi:hypothetical protein